jgi:amidohydrolase
VISALQSIVSRNVSPMQTAVVSVGSLVAGEAFNVIPSTAVLKGTIRTFDPEVRSQVLQRFEELVRGVGEALGCRVEIDLQSLTPAVLNDPVITQGVHRIAARMYGEQEIDAGYRSMVSEDMAYMMQDVPGCYLLVGSANADQGFNAPHHHPRFDFDERVLPRAAAIMAALIAENSL